MLGLSLLFIISDYCRITISIYTLYDYDVIMMEQSYDKDIIERNKFSWGAVCLSN